MNVIYVKIAVRTMIFFADLVWIGNILKTLWNMPGQHKLTNKYGKKGKLPDATSSRMRSIAITIIMILVTVAAFLM